MQREKNKAAYICIFIVSVISALIVFQLLYNYNNKYTQSGHQPINGLLYIDSTDISADKVNYIINDWEFYEGCLLEPKDFANGLPDTYMQYVSVGERTSLSRQEPFGSGTYSMVLFLPEKETGYCLYLPEIYSAYNLYIDDELILQMGDIQNYKPLVKSQMVYFNASGLTRIVIAVSDHNGLYSGMVYPPAFGSTDAVGRLYDTRIFINCTIFALTLVLFIISVFIAWADKSKNTLIFSLLYLCALGAVCYPLVHMFIGMKNPLWQGIELLSAYMIYTLMLFLQSSLCGINKKVTSVVLVISVVICISVFLYGFLAPLHTVNIRRYFSYVITFYKWMTVICLFSAAAYGTAKGYFKTGPLIFGSGFFASAVAADRLFPLYEPIYCGWFIEIGCTVMILSLGCVHLLNISNAYHMSIVLETEKKQMEKRIEMQKESYDQISEEMNNTKRLRHDMKQHIYVMERFLKEGQYEKLKNYLNSYKTSFDKTETKLFCHNLTINALLHYYYMRSKKISADFNVSLSADKDLPVCDTDLSIILGNLIENSIEACERQKNGKRIISVYVSADDNKLMLCIKNTFDGNVLKKDGKFLSVKNNHFGIGIESVKKTAKKYGGVVKIEHNATEFKVSVGIFY